MNSYDLDDLERRDPAVIARLTALLEPVLWRWFRPVVRGLDRIPSGAALYVGNHNGAFLTPDTFIFGVALFRELGLDYVPYGLGHEIAIAMPPFRQILLPLGAVRASHDNALRLFADGRKVLVYPGGDYDAMRPYRHRNRVVFGPRRGYNRLALRAGVPIVPVVTAGAHETLLILDDGRPIARFLRLDKLLRLKVFPITLSLPWGLTFGPPPTHLPLPTRIFTEALDPISFDRSGEEAANDRDYVEACHDRVLAAMQASLTELAAERLASGGKVLL